jgi:hypothetical protein
MGFFSRKSREPEVALTNLCPTCGLKHTCFDGRKYKNNTQPGDLGIVDCDNYMEE